MERLKWIELNWINKINQCILLSFASVNKCELCEMHPCYGLYCWLFVTPWTVARQASLSFTISQSLIKLMSIESVMPSNHLILCCPFSFCLQSFLASGSFPVSWLFASGGQRIVASASIPPINISGLISFRIDCFVLLTVQWALNILLQHHMNSRYIPKAIRWNLK